MAVNQSDHDGVRGRSFNVRFWSLSERLVGTAGPGVGLTGGASVHRQSGVGSTLPGQSGPPGEPVPVPLAQPLLLHEQPALRPAPAGGRPLPPLDPEHLLPPLLHLLLLPPLHEQPHRRPGVQDGGGGGLGGAGGPER